MHPFAKPMTNLDSFYASPSRLTALPSPVNFMHTVDYFPYSDTAVPDFQILQLRFRGTMSMILALPVSDDFAPIDFQNLEGILAAGMKSTKVAVALPKFHFESVYEDNLKRSLQSMGLRSTFERGLCFGGEGGCNTKVSSVIQKTVFTVNEDGVEAAAVTAVKVDRAAPLPDVPVPFLANHPFQFFIYESEQDVVLFEGRVGDPGATYNVEEPSLGAHHNDTSFWTKTFNVDPKPPTGTSSTSLLWVRLLGTLGMIGMTVILS